MNTQVYDVLFPDGGIRQYSANIIAENIFSQVDEEGHKLQLLRHIVSHRKDKNALDKAEGHTISPNGRKVLKHTTKGWYFEVEWADGTTSWTSLKELKHSNPVELAQYCERCDLLDEPAIAWWVKYVLKKSKQIVSKIKARTKKKNMKYGIDIPRNVKEAKEYDRRNGNDLWAKAIAKEMRNVRVAFDVLEKGRNLEPGRTYLECYLIFDIKMNFTRKARFVANGSKTPDPMTSTYAGVVSRESVRIAFVYAALNELDVMTADIQMRILQHQYQKSIIQYVVQNLAQNWKDVKLIL